MCAVSPCISRHTLSENRLFSWFWGCLIFLCPNINACTCFWKTRACTCIWKPSAPLFKIGLQCNLLWAATPMNSQPPMEAIPQNGILYTNVPSMSSHLPLEVISPVSQGWLLIAGSTVSQMHIQIGVELEWIFYWPRWPDSYLWKLMAIHYWLLFFAEYKMDTHWFR